MNTATRRQPPSAYRSDQGAISVWICWKAALISGGGEAAEVRNASAMETRSQCSRPRCVEGGVRIGIGW